VCILTVNPDKLIYQTCHVSCGFQIHLLKYCHVHCNLTLFSTLFFTNNCFWAKVPARLHHGPCQKKFLALSHTHMWSWGKEKEQTELGKGKQIKRREKETGKRNRRMVSFWHIFISQPWHVCDINVEQFRTSKSSKNHFCSYNENTMQMLQLLDIQSALIKEQCLKKKSIFQEI